MTYDTSCPSCAQPLTPLVGKPDVAPWQCLKCGRAFFVTELSAESRAVYRKAQGDWGVGPETAIVRAGVELDYADAQRRGVSTLPEQVALLNKTGLKIALTHVSAALVKDETTQAVSMSDSINAALATVGVKGRVRGLLRR